MRIGSFRLEIPILFAPLAGITDASTRSIASEMGASLTYSEMISAKGLIYNNKNTENLLYIKPDEGPVAFQIFGHEPDVIRQAAERLADRKNVLLDINMGCPVPKIVKNGEGSALMKDVNLVYDIVRAAVDGTDGKKPVTVKMRKGFDEGSINAPEVAKACEAAGAAAVTVHGRTREQYYSGKADWNIIADVKKSVGIPVIGNGDIFSAEDAVRMMKMTGCDGVMVARGALGNPWIFREIRSVFEGGEEIGKPTDREVFDLMIRHYEMLVEEKGEKRAVFEMRKHVAWYIKGMYKATELRRKVNTVTSGTELRKLLEDAQNIYT